VLVLLLVGVGETGLCPGGDQVTAVKWLVEIMVECKMLVWDACCRVWRSDFQIVGQRKNLGNYVSKLLPSLPQRDFQNKIYSLHLLCTPFPIWHFLEVDSIFLIFEGPQTQMRAFSFLSVSFCLLVGFVFWDRISLCSPGWPQTGDPPASAPWVLRL
jgi:hypothetical protein